MRHLLTSIIESSVILKLLTCWWRQWWSALCKAWTLIRFPDMFHVCCRLISAISSASLPDDRRLQYIPWQRNQVFDECVHLNYVVCVRFGIAYTISWSDRIISEIKRGAERCQFTSINMQNGLKCKIVENRTCVRH